MKVRSALAGIAGALAVGACLVPSAAAAPQHLEAYTVRISQAQIDVLRQAGIDMHEVTLPSAGTARVPVVLTAKQAKALRAKGVSTRLVTRNGQTTTQRTKRLAAAGYTVYRSYSEPGGIEDEMRALAAANPRITQLVTIGHSVQGQPILALRVTKNPQRYGWGSKPSVLYSATQHAREWIATETDRRLMHYFVDGYATNPIAHRLVDTRELWFVPVANPDGYDFTFTPGNRLWRKNLRDNNGDGVIEAAFDGVDPNRNFATNWNQDDEGSNTNFDSETYRGPAPNSEPETRAMDGLLRRVRFEVQINYHSAAQLLLYPFGNEVDLKSDDDSIFEALSGTDGPDPDDPTDDDSAIPGYDPDLGAELYTTNGETTDQAYTKYHTFAWTPELDTASSYGAVGVSDFEFPDDEAKIQSVFEKNIPFALNVATSAANMGRPRNSGANIPGEYQVKSVPDFQVDKFAESYGNPQVVQTNVRRDLGPVVLRYKINGGHTRTAFAREWHGGDFYGGIRGAFYHKVRASVHGAHVGDTVQVWFQAGRKTSESFTYTVAYDGRAKVLLVAAEDYTGNSPGPPYAGPLYLDTHVAALRAAGIEPVVYDVDAKGRVAPDALGVLAHFKAVVWYSGGDVIPREPTQGPGTASILAHNEIVAMRDYLNEGGRVFASGENLPYAHFNAYPYPPGTTAPVPLTDDVFQYYFGAYRYQGGLDTDKFVDAPVAPVGSLIPFDVFTPNAADFFAPSQFLFTSSFLDRTIYPRFASSPFANYVFTGPQREDPIEGSFQAYAASTDENYKRLTRTIDVPAGTTTFDFQSSWDTEQDYDFVIVEAHTVGADDWTTLPDLNGNTTQTLLSCEIAWNSLHPFIDHYQTFDPATSTCTPTGTTGAWNGLTGDSAGWTQVSYDLSAFAGKTVEVSISYVQDFASAGNGVQVDDVRLTTDGTTTPITGFETDLGGFTVSGAPAGSGTNRNDWTRIGKLDLPGEPAAGVVTTDTVFLPFGLEQVPAVQRDQIVKGAMRWLLRNNESPPPA